jgi:hypothetical protein
MRRLFVVGALLVACKGNPSKLEGTSGSGSAVGSANDPHVGLVLDAGAPLPVDAACEAAISKAAAAAPTERVAILLNGCKVCGDWTTLFRWNTPQGSGGPARSAIEAAMMQCQGFCNGEAKLKFMGTLDDARGTASRMPWKQLGIACGEKVSALPDGRYLDGAYFALDRIARSVGAKGGDIAAKAATIEFPLPAVGVVGIGPPLATVEGVSTLRGADLQITVLGNTLSVGVAPRARLTADGLKVELGEHGYPGTSVKVGELAATLTAMQGDAKKTVMIIAPKAAPAKDLVPAIQAASMVMPVHLAVHAVDAPDGWEVPAILDVPLETKGKNALRIADGMTVQQLAEALAKPKSP